MSEQVRTAADNIRSEISAKASVLMAHPQIAELVQLIQSLNILEGILQVPKTTLASLLAVDGESTDSVPKSVTAVTRDEFVHVPALEAAKRYLRKAGKPARTLEEIIKAIKSGGGDVPNISTLRTQLIRSTADIKKVADDVFGLLEWYPKRRGRPPGSGGGGNGGEQHDDEDFSETEENAAKPADLTAPGEGEQGGGDS